jgi:hypothetical protein
VRPRGWNNRGLTKSQSLPDISGRVGLGRIRLVRIAFSDESGRSRREPIIVVARFVELLKSPDQWHPGQLPEIAKDALKTEPTQPGLEPL